MPAHRLAWPVRQYDLVFIGPSLKQGTLYYRFRRRGDNRNDRALPASRAGPRLLTCSGLSRESSALAVSRVGGNQVQARLPKRPCPLQVALTLLHVFSL